jgi:hypothetical protein
MGGGPVEILTLSIVDERTSRMDGLSYMVCFKRTAYCNSSGNIPSADPVKGHVLCHVLLDDADKPKAACCKPCSPRCPRWLMYYSSGYDSNLKRWNNPNAAARKLLSQIGVRFAKWSQPASVAVADDLETTDDDMDSSAVRIHAAAIDEPPMPSVSGLMDLYTPLKYMYVDNVPGPV